MCAEVLADAARTANCKEFLKTRWEARENVVLTRSDFQKFDLIIAMDSSNLRNAQNLATTQQDKAKVQLLLDHGAAVPDPYYGGKDGFEKVYQLINEAVETLVEGWKP